MDEVFGLEWQREHDPHTAVLVDQVYGRRVYHEIAVCDEGGNVALSMPVANFNMCDILFGTTVGNRGVEVVGIPDRSQLLLRQRPSRRCSIFLKCREMSFNS